MLLLIGGEALYEGNLLAFDQVNFTTSPWTGPSALVARRQSGSQTNFIIATVELPNLNGANNIDLFFQKVLTGEFGL